MCGLAGSFGPGRPGRGAIDGALAALAKRGPDANGWAQEDLNGSCVTLVHTRLSIIDLDARADQPFEDDDCVLVYNGELYNFVELRSELAGLGHRFKTSSDTEVVLRAYLQWGEACFDRFEGMWALALVDRKKGRMLLSRDRFGEKPLFYWFHEGTLYFASEIAGLAALAGRWPEVDHQQVRRYLVNGYKSLNKESRSFHRDVHPLPAASFAMLDAPAPPRCQRYWSLTYSPVAMSADDAVAGARERLFRSMEIRLRADVPLAFCLSGGVDSSALAALAAKRFDFDVHTFSIIDSDPRYDESENIDTTVAAIGSKHVAIETTPAGFFERLERLVRYHASPIATVSYYVHSFLSEAIRDAGFKIAISGTAADELFTGYYDHYGFWLAEMAESQAIEPLIADWRESYGAFVRNPLLRDPLAFRDNPGERGHIMPNRAVFSSYLREPFDEAFSETDYADNTLRNRMLNELNHEVIPVILQEDDLNSMMHSVENRSPYLDRDLCEFMYSVPNQHLIRDGYAKWVLREAVDGVLPDAVRLDKRKRGFNASILSFIDPAQDRTRDRLLAESPIFDIVDRRKMERALTGDFSDNEFSKFLFSFVSAKLFLEASAANANDRVKHVA